MTFWAKVVAWAVTSAWPWIQKNWKASLGVVLALLLAWLWKAWKGAEARADAAEAQAVLLTEKLKTAEAKGSVTGRTRVTVRPSKPVAPGQPAPCPEVDVEGLVEAASAAKVEEWEAAVDRGGDGPQTPGKGPWTGQGQARRLGVLSGALGVSGWQESGILPYIGGAYHFPAFGMDLGLDGRVAFPYKEGQTGPVFSGGLVFRP